jgi:hypothetical protein
MLLAFHSDLSDMRLGTVRTVSKTSACVILTLSNTSNNTYQARMHKDKGSLDKMLSVSALKHAAKRYVHNTSRVIAGQRLCKVLGNLTLINATIPSNVHKLHYMRFSMNRVPVNCTI